MNTEKEMDKDILYGFFNGTASHSEEMRVREWLEASAENRRIFMEERRLFDMLLLNTREDTGSRTAVRRTRAAVILKEAAKVAAVAAIVITVCVSYFRSREHTGTPAMQTVSVPAGQRVNITLPDGTNVWLNACSSLRYPASFNRSERTLALDGEAYFEVTGNKKKPFAVQTKQGVIEVTGTSFNVDAYASEERFETVLMSGSLKVRLNDDPESSVWLTPDRKATLKDGKLQVEPVDNYIRYRWREGLICFSNASFADIMRDFERYYGVSVRVENTRVMKYSYTGKFRYTDGIDYALNVLRRDIRFSYRRDYDTQTIYIE
jgi:ferric-dicitrate binding protein FerR (iron transport regulator)